MEGHVKKMRRAILWSGKQECGLTLQSFTSLCGWSSMSNQDELESVVGQFVRSIVLTCLYLSRIGPFDILCSVNKLARSVTKWTQACDRRLARLITYIHHANDFRQYCHVMNEHGTAFHTGFVSGLRFCWRSWGLIINLRWCLMYFRKSHICVNKLETSVSHSSTEAEIISLDAGSRMDGIPALDLWRFSDRSTPLSTKPTGKTCRITPHSTCKTKFQPSTPILIWVMLITFRRTWDLPGLGKPSAANPTIQATRKLVQFLIPKPRLKQMMIKGRSPTMRHVSRTHCVALDWLFDRINLEPQIQINYVDTKNQPEDTLTKVSQEMIGMTFFVCSILSVSRCSLAAISAIFLCDDQVRKAEHRVEKRSEDAFEWRLSDNDAMSGAARAKEWGSLFTSEF